MAIPDTSPSTDVQAQVLTVSFLITFSTHGVTNTASGALFKSPTYSAELMLGGCDLVITPRTVVDAAWTTNTIHVKRELSPTIVVGDTSEIAFTFGEGGRCGGVLSQAYRIDEYT